MTLEYRCSNCGTLLQTTNADPIDAEIKRLRAALNSIRRLNGSCDLTDAWAIVDRTLEVSQS